MNDAIPGLLVRHEARRGAPTQQQTQATYASYSVGDRAGPSVGSVLASLRGRLGLVSSVALAVCAVGAGVTLMRTSGYSATALLIVNPNPSPSVRDKTPNAAGNNQGMVD